MKSNIYEKYGKQFFLDNMMGPNSMLVCEELTKNLDLKKGMKVLDLGCGKGLSSIFLAEKFGVTVYAADLWIHPTENFERFKKLGFENKIIPILAEGSALPFAHEYFDAVISVDSYHYFGNKEGYLDEHVLPLIKKGGTLALAMPGFKEDIKGVVPEWLKPFWVDNMNFYSCKWWKNLIGKSDVKINNCWEMESFEQGWKEWLECDEIHAKGDIPMMEAGGWKYFNLVALTAEKNK